MNVVAILLLIMLGVMVYLLSTSRGLYWRLERRVRVEFYVFIVKAKRMMRVGAVWLTSFIFDYLKAGLHQG
jgi:hypothetical protein